MVNYDYPNEEELQPYVPHNYDLVNTEYPIWENIPTSDYNQFIQLRDTLVYSGKKYNGKAGCKLCIGEKEETVEVQWNNMYRQLFDTIALPTENIFVWPYVEFDSEIMGNANFWNLGWVIQKDWWYRLLYKIEVVPTAQTNKVYTYFDIYRKKENPTEWDTFPYVLTEPGWTAVFDRECNTTLSGTTSGTDPNGTCTVPFTLWELFKKLTAFWYIEKNLNKGDVVVLRAKDAERWTNPLPAWNDLAFQAGSNYLSIEYIGTQLIPLTNNN